MSNDEQLPASDLNLDELVPPGFSEPPTLGDKVPAELVDGPVRGTALYDACVTVYNGMHERSTVVHEGRVYKGRISTLFGQLEVSMGLYSKVMKRLKDMGCIDQLARGGGGQPSIFMLYASPTPSAFESTRNGGYISKERATTAELQTIVAYLSQRVAHLEGQMANMVEWRQQEVMRRDRADKVLAFKDAIQPNAKGL